MPSREDGEASRRRGAFLEARSSAAEILRCALPMRIVYDPPSCRAAKTAKHLGGEARSSAAEILRCAPMRIVY